MACSARNRGVRAAILFLGEGQDFGMDPISPSSKHNRKKVRGGCYSAIWPEGGGSAGEDNVVVWWGFHVTPHFL
jgi:hypothetical protein